MKIKSKLFVRCLLLSACLAGGPGLTTAKAWTEIFFYPLARAFGGPSEGELVKCRAAFKQLQAHLATSRVVVMPVLFVDGGHREWRKDLAAVELRELAAQTSAKLEASPVEPRVAASNFENGHNQLRYLTKRSTVYGSWIKAAHPAGDYILVTEIFGQRGSVGAIQVYLFDSSGQEAYGRLLNSHHFGHLPMEGDDAPTFIVKTFFKNLKMDAKRLYPPYGVG